MIPRYVLDTGALIAAERGKERAARFLRLAHVGRARLVVPLPVVAEWWRGRTDVRDAILGATSIVASVDAAKAAGLALGRIRSVDGRMTVDAIVMATALFSTRSWLRVTSPTSTASRPTSQGLLSSPPEDVEEVEDSSRRRSKPAELLRPRQTQG